MRRGTQGPWVQRKEEGVSPSALSCACVTRITGKARLWVEPGDAGRQSVAMAPFWYPKTHWYYLLLWCPLWKSLLDLQCSEMGALLLGSTVKLYLWWGVREQQWAGSYFIAVEHNCLSRRRLPLGGRVSVWQVDANLSGLVYLRGMHWDPICPIDSREEIGHGLGAMGWGPSLSGQLWMGAIPIL